ncbi:S-layer homology domain-containing protein [Neobacillus sp. D3-1R]|uniref:S-layer homology domain-containing protein n=1 Tax=Neobacillus sp. D3-1R TaxID=3445778 RepID=UPI003FA0BCBF
MVKILRHELKTQGNETILTLYLDPSLTEFAKELGHVDKEKNADLNTSVNSYIQNKIPNLKQATVKIMVGSMLVTSFAFTPAVAGMFKGKEHRAYAAELDQAQQQRFTDVAADRESATAINALVDAGVITGYPDGTFKPRAEITRQHAAVMFARALKLDLENVTDPGFKDVPKTHQYYREIAAATAAGLFQKGESFNPTANFTRGQSASVIVRAYDLDGDKTTPFTDQTGSGHDDAIGVMYNLGLTKGTTATTFAPNDNVKREQFAMLLQRTIESKAGGEVETPPTPEVPAAVEVASVNAAPNAFFATANKNIKAFDVVNFLDKDGNVVDTTDYSKYKVYDNRGFFNDDGSLAAAYKDNGLTTTGKVTIQITNSETNAKMGEFTVDVVDGNAYSTILDGVVKNTAGTTVQYATLGSSFAFDITKAIKYNNDVIGDEEGETIGLGTFTGADLSSSDPTVMVVTDDGTITTIKEGTANILVKWNDKTYTYPVEVKAAPVVNSIDINGGTTFDLTTADNTRTFTYQVKDQHGANFSNAITIEPTDAAAPVAGITMSDDDKGTITVTANTSLVTKDTQATYNIKSGDKTIGTVTVNYQQAGAATSYVLRTTAADNVLDYYMDGTNNRAVDNSASYEFVGLDDKGLVAEVSSASDGTAKTITANGKTYTVTLTGVDATNPEATLGFEGGKVTVTATDKATAAGKDVTLTVKEGNITRATQTITVKNTTPAPSELVSYNLAEGVSAVKVNGTHTFADLVRLGYFTAIDQYGNPYDLSAQDVKMYSTDEKVFTINEDGSLTVTGDNGAKASLVVALGGSTKVFDLVVDKAAPVAVVDTASTATSLKLNFNENVKTLTATPDTVTGTQDVAGKKTATLTVPAETPTVSFTVTDSLGNSKDYTATLDATAGTWTVADTPAAPVTPAP